MLSHEYEQIGVLVAYRAMHTHSPTRKICYIITSINHFSVSFSSQNRTQSLN